MITHYVDANLHHDLTTGKAVSAMVHLVNAIVQSTVKIATFDLEFVAARTAVGQVMDIRNTLMYRGVPVRPTSYIFGENKSVVDRASISIPVFSNRSLLTAYHQVSYEGSHCSWISSFPLEGWKK